MMIRWRAWAQQLSNKKPPNESSPVMTPTSPNSPNTPNLSPQPKKPPRASTFGTHVFTASLPDDAKQNPELLEPSSPTAAKEDQENQQWMATFQRNWKQKATEPAPSPESNPSIETSWTFTPQLMNYQTLLPQMQFALATVPEMPPATWEIPEQEIPILPTNPSATDYNWIQGVYQLQQASKLYPVLTSLMRYYNLVLES
jgi:hypothetical protein